MDPSAGDWFQAERVSGSRSQLERQFSLEETVGVLISKTKPVGAGRCWLACEQHCHEDMTMIGVHMALYRMLSELLESHTVDPIAISHGQWHAGSVEASRLFWRSRQRGAVAGE
jgi:hypothetical protein